MERVSFLIESTGMRLPCLLNPETLVVRRLAGVRPRRGSGGALAGAGLADDPLLHTGGGRTQLDLDLLFDVMLAGASISTEDVRDLTSPLWAMVENSAGADGQGRAPRVRFVWGKSWNVPGVIVSAAERLENFTPQGVARRSWLRLRLWRTGDALRPLPAEDPIAGPSARETGLLLSPPPGGYAIREIRGGGGPGGNERLDTFLARNGVSPRHWKQVAELNGLHNPYEINPATSLRLPLGAVR